jgi:hypothetical protein
MTKATGRLPRTLRLTAMVALAFIALACLGDVLRPAMAVAGQHCFGVGCADQIACGQPASPSASSTSTAHPIPMVLVGGDAGLVAEPAPAWPTWLSGSSLDQQPIAPFAPRSPPLA